MEDIDVLQSRRSMNVRGQVFQYDISLPFKTIMRFKLEPYMRICALRRVCVGMR